MQSKGVENPEELLSAAFDGEHTGAPDVSESRKRELDAEWISLRLQLQSLPVVSVDLSPAVQSDLADKRQPATELLPTQSRSWRSTAVAISMIAVAIVVVALPLMQHGITDHRASNILAIQETLNDLVTPPTPANCNVVVVNVGVDSSMEDTVRDLLGAAEIRGAQVTSLHSEVDKKAEYSAGFLLTAGTESQVILDSLADEQENLEWNPADINGRSYEEIRAMFLTSMTIPTESDRVFGAMYVVDEISLAVTSKAVPANDVELPTTALAMSDESTSEARIASETAANSPEMPTGTPLIVIFRQQTAVQPKAAEPEQSELPHLMAPRPAV